MEIKYENHGCWMCGENNPDGFRVKFIQEDDSVFFKTSIPSKYQGYNGIVHGGLISSLLDEAMANCFFLIGIKCVTAEISVKFLKPLPVEHEVIVTGRMVDRQRKMGTTKGWIEDEKGIRYAEGEGKFYFIED